MRKRYQEGNVKKQRGVWIAQWWENGHRRSRALGSVWAMTKTEAKAEVAAIVAPINLRERTASERCTLADFVEQIFLPFYRRKWKRSTALSNQERISFHLISEFGKRGINRFNRDELQEFLDRKAAKGLSYSVVSHLRWDLKQILELAVEEGYISRNPASLLFVPKAARRAEKLVMNLAEVKKVFSLLEQRERLIAKLAVLAGMRPGEIFGLTWGRLQDEYAEIRQRVYRGEVDTPKTTNSVREVALPDGLLAEIEAWRKVSIDTQPKAWVFPSEKLTTPLSKDNCWRRWIAPKLKQAGLEWVNFQVMRRTHSSLLSDLNVHPKVVADQLGHTVDVNQNVYTKTALGRRKKAVNSLEFALGNL
jgi:integrase